MADAIETRRAELIESIAEIDDALSDIRSALTGSTDKALPFIDSRTQVSGADGGDRQAQLIEQKRMYERELAELPYEVHSEVAIGHDALGGDAGETYADSDE